MDEQKDIRTSEVLASFFSRPALRGNAPFNQSADRLYRRAERIVAGVFLATNHLVSSEQLRVTVRAAAIRLLENALSVRDEIRATQSESVAQFRLSIRHNISLVRMLAVSGFLSIQNATVLVEALDELGNFFSTAQRSPLSESVSFTKQDFLDVGGTAQTFIKDIKYVKDKHAIKDTQAVSDTPTKRSLDVRKQAVMEVLRTGGELGIADIAANLPEYSTKMIQRELADLVTLGKVKKTGLKRWSRYALSV